MTTQSIIKLLTAAGIGSRRQITAIIKRGGVTVNGRVIENFNEPINPDTDTVKVNGEKAATAAEPHVYIMLNKPKGIISAAKSDRREKTVIDLLPEKFRRLRIYPVGRLDKDSTGLILLTNDGDLTFRLTHPRFELEKEYLVCIEGNLKPEEIREIETGMELTDGDTAPARLKAYHNPPYNYAIIIHEGRKRQVRRMFANLGHIITDLKRIRFGTLKLGTLPEGEYRELTIKELNSLKNGRA